GFTPRVRTFRQALSRLSRAMMVRENGMVLMTMRVIKDGFAKSQGVAIELRSDWGTFFAATSKGFPSHSAHARHLRKEREKRLVASPV
ncbi:MAG: hypothetical protein AB1547_12965, partial [Thermodesulfobacteriota bacterium]